MSQADRNLLFGILAVQMNFVGRDALIAAMHAWVLERAKPLGRILVERHALTPARQSLLEQLVDEHLAAHGDDAEKSLSALYGVGPIPEGLRHIADPELHASLDRMTAHPDPTARDPEATTTCGEVSALAAGSRFSILRPHARGGLGQVSVALDSELNREVALKELRPERADDPGSRARFLLEAEVTGRLEHPGVVPVYGLGSDTRGRPFYAMRFVRGDTLREAIDRFFASGGPTGSDATRWNLSLRELLNRFVAVCNVMAYAHSRGVIHRDLKPANILLGPYGETLVVDWGLAKVVGRGEEAASSGAAEATLQPGSGSGSSETLPGTALGTPAYMGPEQAEGRLDQVGPLSDVYSLGATLFCLLTGKPPIDEADIGEALRRVQRGEFPPPRQIDRRVPPALEAICLRAMALRPHGRYPTARALADEIEHWLADEPVSAYRDPIPARAARWARRHKTAAVGLGILLATAVAALAVSTALIGHEQARTVRQLYVNRVNLANRECLAGNVTYAERLLDDCPTALRGWEWEFCRGLSHREALSLTGHGASSATTANAWYGLVYRGVLAACYSPDGRSIASAGEDGTIRIWDARSGEPARVMQAGGATIRGMAFSPDGHWIISAGDDGSVKQWDAATGLIAHTYGPHHGPVNCVAFSPNGLLFASGDDDSIRLWDPATRREVGVIPENDEIVGLAFSPNGDRLASASFDGAVKLWDPATGRVVQLFRGHQAQAFAVVFSPAGRQVASCGADQVVRIWDVETGGEVRALYGHDDWVHGVAFSPDSHQIASAGWDGTVRLWDVDSGEEVTSYRGHSRHINTVTFGPEGGRLVSGGDDRTVKVWDVAKDADVLTFTDRLGWQYVTVFSPDGRRLAIGGYRRFMIRDAASGEVLLYRVRPPNSSGITGLAFSPDGRRIVTGSEGLERAGEVELWDIETGRRIWVGAAGHFGPVCGVAYSPDGRQVASASQDGTLKVWDAEDGREIRTLRAHDGGAFGVAYSPNGLTLASCGWDSAVRLWDARDGSILRTIHGIVRSRHNYFGNPLAFSTNGRRIAGPSDDGTVVVWDVATGRRELTLRGHTGEVYDVSLSADGRRIATAGGDATIKLWDAEDGQEVFTLRGHNNGVLGLAYSPDGRRIASGSIDGTVKIWDPSRTPSEVALPRRTFARAEAIVLGLFNDQLLLKDEVLQRVREDRLEEPVRSAALALASRWQEDPWSMREASWSIVRSPGHRREDYLLALRRAEVAQRAAPEDPICLAAVGEALYRVGRDREALEMLEKARQAFEATTHTTNATIVAFLALAHHRLGHHAEAWSELVRFQALLKSDGRSRSAQLQELLREAEATLSSR